MKTTNHFIFALLVTTVFSCSTEKSDRNNPLDPGGVNFQGWDAPVLSGPSQGTSYTLKWTHVGVDQYVIQEAREKGFTNASQFIVKGCSYTFNHIEDGEPYYYRVKTNSGNHDSVWSNTQKILINLGLSSSPVNGTTGVSTSTNLSWEFSSALIEDIYYDVKLGVSEESLVTVASNLKQKNYYPGNMEILTLYYWQVIMHYQNTSYASPVWHFTTGEYTTPDIGIAFVYIPGGTFQMGDEIGDLSDGCRPVHSVTISDFEMSAYEITNAQYAVYLNEAKTANTVTVTNEIVTGTTGEWNDQEYIDLAGNEDSRPDNDCKITYSSSTFSVKSGYENWPVMWVTWYGAKAFAEHYDIDLPREAEWEYVCRGENHRYKYGTNDGTINSSNANVGNYIGHPVDVGSYPMNHFGIYDMCGNVPEWCADVFGYYTTASAINPVGAPSGYHRVIRGGSCYCKYLGCRSANRWPITASGSEYYGYGFRVVCRLPSQ